jgi:N-terminal acetyltransferase B complex non-catalytic subunit
MTLCGGIGNLIHDQCHDPQSIKQAEVQELAAALVNFPTLFESARPELTDAEAFSCKLHSYLGKAMTLRLQHSSAPVNSAAESAHTTFNDSVRQMENWLKETVSKGNEDPSESSSGVIFIEGQPLAPSWQYLHAAFSTLESLQSISLFLHSQTPIPKSKPNSSTIKQNTNAFTVPATQRSQMQASVLQAEKAIHASALRLKENLASSGILGNLIDTVFARSPPPGSSSSTTTTTTTTSGSNALGSALDRLPDAESVAEGFCGELRESWEDALQGILGVRVRP